jgi:hypothetical protein
MPSSGVLSHIPRNSTQLISILFLSPSADNGRSASRLRSTKGPTSGAVRSNFVEGVFSGSCASILNDFALKLPSSHISRQMPAHRAVSRLVCVGGVSWDSEGRLPNSEDEALRVWSKPSKHKPAPLNPLLLPDSNNGMQSLTVRPDSRYQCSSNIWALEFVEVSRGN